MRYDKSSMRGRVVINQRGMATFAVTTVLILVISLIIIGFSQVVQRNQRETLDRQLSTQAFYAAESGVNTVVASIRDQLSAGGSLPPNKDNCGPHASYPTIQPLNAGTEITCLLVSTDINTLVYDGVTESSPTVVPLESAGPIPIGSITLSWSPTSAPANPSQNCSGTGFTTRANWLCGHGVLRSDLTTQPNGNTNGFAMSTFFNPRQQTTASTISFGSGGGLTTGSCSDVGESKCVATITGLNAVKYYMNLRSIYRDSSVKITGIDVNGQNVKFIGQVLVDVTAKSEDVLRRIQVRVPLEARGVNDLPPYAIQSTDSICKRFSVEPNYFNNNSLGCN